MGFGFGIMVFQWDDLAGIEMAKFSHLTRSGLRWFDSQGFGASWSWQRATRAGPCAGMLHEQRCVSIKRRTPAVKVDVWSALSKQSSHQPEAVVRGFLVNSSSSFLRALDKSLGDVLQSCLAQKSEHGGCPKSGDSGVCNWLVCRWEIPRIAFGLLKAHVWFFSTCLAFSHGSKRNGYFKLIHKQAFLCLQLLAQLAANALQKRPLVNSTSGTTSRRSELLWSSCREEFR